MAKSQTSGSTAPEIVEVTPKAAIPGGEFLIRGRSLTSNGRPSVRIGDVSAPVIVGSRSLVVARVPEGASVGEITIGETGNESKPWICDVGIQIADALHPVANPAIDAEGNIFVTFSGSRGQKTPVSVFKIDQNYQSKPFVTDLLNATGLAFDREGILYISSRSEGSVYQSTATGNLSVYVEGMGIGTGLAFDREGNLYVGDRSGTIFKISQQRQIYVFATVEPSIAAYHLAFGPDDHLYVTGPTTSSFDCVHRVSPDGAVESYFRGLGRPQGIAFDAEGRMYVAASLSGRRGIVRIDQDRNAELFLSGPNIVGLAFLPSKALAIATSNALYRVDVNVAGKPLP
jgi:sugar lactone lactonase YvrE